MLIQAMKIFLLLLLALEKVDSDDKEEGRKYNKANRLYMSKGGRTMETAIANCSSPAGGTSSDAGSCQT
jgi:hypothetical protein